MKTSGLMVLIASLLAQPEIVVAEESGATLPDHATARSYGNGWDCNAGYRKSEDSCVLINVPPHAYLSDRGYGRGWECVWGYREANGHQDEQAHHPPNGT